MTHKEEMVDAVIQVLSDGNMFGYSEVEPGIEYSTAIIVCCEVDDKFDQEIDRCVAMFFGDRAMNNELASASYTTDYGDVEINGSTDPWLKVRISFRRELDAQEEIKMSDKTEQEMSDKKED